MDSVNLTLRLQSRYRFRLPSDFAESNDDLEEGAEYEIEIKDKVREAGEEPDEIRNGVLGKLIAEDNAR